MKNQAAVLTASLIALALATLFVVAQPARAQSAERQRFRRHAPGDQAPARRSQCAQANRTFEASRHHGLGRAHRAARDQSQKCSGVGRHRWRFPLARRRNSGAFARYAEAHLIHDFKGFGAPDDDTNLSGQPLDNSGSPKCRTQLTAETSRLGFETSTPTGVGSVNTKLEIDFYSYRGGNGNRLRLRRAYGEYAGWLIGLTWSTFMDQDNLPETVDFNGPIGAPFSRRTMIRYSHADAKEGNKCSVALEDPEDPFAGGTVNSANEKMPQRIARFDKACRWGALNARVLGHEKSSFSATKRGFGIGVGGSYKLRDKDVLMGRYTRVDGDVDQLYGSNGYAVDTTTGAITFDKNQDLVVAYAKTCGDQLRGNLVFGTNRGRTAQALDNRTLTRFHVGLIYSPIKTVELGAELISGKRTTFTDDTGTMACFDVMERYSF